MPIELPVSLFEVGLCFGPLFHVSLCLLTFRFDCDRGVY